VEVTATTVVENSTENKTSSTIVDKQTTTGQSSPNRESLPASDTIGSTQTDTTKPRFIDESSTQAFLSRKAFLDRVANEAVTASNPRVRSAMRSRLEDPILQLCIRPLPHSSWWQQELLTKYFLRRLG
jgi:hypothetical protein